MARHYTFLRSAERHVPPSPFQPHNLPELLRQAAALRAKGEAEAAIAVLRHATTVAPADAEVHHHLGNALKSLLRHAEARPVLTRARDLAPNDAVIRLNLGATLLALGAPAEAIAEFEVAVAREPRRAEAHNILGCALLAASRIGDAVDHFRTALQLQPGYSAAHDNLGRAFRAQGRAAEALAEFRAALKTRANATTYSNLLYALNFVPGLSPAAVAGEHRGWAALHALPATETRRWADRASDPHRRLRVGYVSPDFVHHAVAFFIEPILAAHRRDEVEVFCYANVPAPDAVTVRLRGLSEHWRDIARLDDAGAAELIRRDQIDLLVDLAGHTAGNRLTLFARRPAPLQFTWLGYPNTTGLDSIDYRITDEICDPPNCTEAFHSERLLRLRGAFCCYQPPRDAPAVRVPPVTQNSHVTFGSCNHFAKLQPGVLELWARLLASVPDSRLLLKAHSLADHATAEHVRATFARFGVQSARLDLRSEKTSVAAHLATYHEIDVALDPFPYSGTTTTCEALWMGVPVITMAGATHVSRVTASLLTHLGRPEWIANSEDECLALGTSLAANSVHLAAERSAQRERMRTSPLCDAEGFTLGLESAYRAAWRDWAERPAN